jgi:DNA polymerase I-like protein with 3'-5' exonuclease and polymerase domains
VRGGVRYTQEKNTPFQGLAADGMKLAVFKLARHGFRTVAVIHDEVVVEIPDDAHIEENVIKIKSWVEGEMTSVLNGTVPIATEHKLDTCWMK